MSNNRFVCTSQELRSLSGRLPIRTASILAGGTVTAGLVGAHRGGLLVTAAAELGLLAEAALLAGALGGGHAVVAAAELEGVAVTACVVGA